MKASESNRAKSKSGSIFVARSVGLSVIISSSTSHAPIRALVFFKKQAVVGHQPHPPSCGLYHQKLTFLTTPFKAQYDDFRTFRTLNWKEQKKQVQSVCWSVCHNFLKGWEVLLPRHLLNFKEH